MFVPDFPRSSRYPELKPLVRGWAGHYTQSEAVAARIAQRTIVVAATNPELLDGPDVKHDLMALLHALALQEVAVEAAPEAHLLNEVKSQIGCWQP